MGGDQRPLFFVRTRRGEKFDAANPRPSTGIQESTFPLKKKLESREGPAYNAIPPRRTAPDAKESGRVRESGWFFEKRAEHHEKVSAQNK
jgi:hypothetical protein